MSISSPQRERPFIPMNGKAIVDSIAPISPSVMAKDNGQLMLMEMAFERFIPIPLKAFGRPFATFCVPFGAFIRSFLPGMLPYVSFALTANTSRLTLSQSSSIALILNMSQSKNWTGGDIANSSLPVFFARFCWHFTATKQSRGDTDARFFVGVGSPNPLFTYQRQCQVSIGRFSKIDILEWRFTSRRIFLGRNNRYCNLYNFVCNLCNFL